MRTEQDLRVMLTTRERLAPDPDQVLAGARKAALRYRRRRRTATALTAAGGAVAVVVTVPVMIMPGSSGPGPGSAPPPPATVMASPSPDLSVPRQAFSFTINPGTAAGFEIHPVSTAPEYQLAQIRRPGEEQARATLVVYQPGSDARVGGDAPGWDLEQVARTPVRVGDAPGWFTANADASVLRWEYAPDGFAVIGTGWGEPLDQQTLLKLAEGVQFTPPYQVRLPYRLDYLPAVLEPFHVGQDTATPGSYHSVLQLENPDGEGAPYGMDISIWDIRPAEQDDWDWQPATIAGYPAECADLVDGRRCEVDLGEVTVSLGCGALTPDQLDRIVAGISLADWDDPGTWYALDDALPGD